jgi:hypothetical protein
MGAGVRAGTYRSTSRATAERVMCSMGSRMTEAEGSARVRPLPTVPAGRVPVAVWLSAQDASIDITEGIAEPKADAQRGTSTMRIAVASDHAGFHLKEHVKVTL